MGKWKITGAASLSALLAATTGLSLAPTIAMANQVKRAPAKVVVTLMTWETPQMNAMIMQSLKLFERRNPNITVKLLPTPLQNFGTKINAMLQAHQAPSIFETGNDTEQQWGAQGVLYNYLPMAVKQKGFLQHFFPGTIPNWEESGKLFGLPALLNVYGVFYNKTLFRQAHLPFPKPGWTLQQMLTDAQKLSSNQGGIHQYGMYNPAYDPFTTGMLAVSAGGAPFANSITHATHVTISPQFESVVRTFQSYIKSGAITPPNFSFQNGTSIFEQGKIPMMTFGQWAADQLIRTAPKSLQWGYAPSPIIKKRAAIFDSVGWASPASVPNPAATFKVLQYLDTTMYAQVLPSTPVAPPAYMPSAGPYYHKLVATGHKNMVASLDYMLRSPNKQPVRFLETWATQAGQFITADWNNIMSGQAPMSTLQGMANQINFAIKNNP